MSKNKTENTSTSRSLLDILVCPDTKSLLIYDKKAQELISVQGKKAYPISQSVPLISENHSRLLSASEIEKWQISTKRK